MFPKSGAPIGTDALSRALLRMSFGVLSKGALSIGAPHGVPSGRDAPSLEPSIIHHSKSPVYDPPSRFQILLVRKGPPPPWRKTSVSGAFLNISSRAPVKKPSPEALRNDSLQRERCFIPTAPFIHLLKFLVDESLLCSPAGLLWKEIPVSRAFSIYPSGSPARGPSLQVPFTELP